MSDVVVSVESISKRYRIGRQESYYRLSEAIAALGRGLCSLPQAMVQRTAKLPRNHESETDFWALKDVSFEVKRGEVVGIIGRNGAGKSTLLKILSRITEPTSGQVGLGGRVGSLLEVGTGFHPELTGRENIFLNGTILGLNRREILRQFNSIVEFAEFAKFIDTPVKRYSSGMYMRLAFAVAAHLETEILIIDEVLAVGDVAFQNKCLGKIGELASNGRTVLFVTHNMNAVENLCTRALLLDSGRLAVSSTNTREVIRTYLKSSNPNSTRFSEWNREYHTQKNEWFYPQRFWIGDANGELLPMPIRNDAEAYIYIDADVEQIDSAMNVGFAISTQSGLPLYWSLTTDMAESEWPKIVNGRNRLRCQLPKRFMNEGEFRLELMASIHYRAWIFQPGVNSPAITLAVQGGLSDSPFWIAARQGLLAPALNWDAITFEGQGATIEIQKAAAASA